MTLNRRIAVLLTLLFTFAYAGQAFAQAWNGTGRYVLEYGVYGGGFQALDIDVVIDMEKNNYDARMNAKPYGVLGKLLPWAGLYETEGTIKKGALVPDHHDKTSAWRDDRDRLVMTYKNGALIKAEKIVNEGKNKKTEILQPPPAYHTNTVDLVTNILAMLRESSFKDRCDFAQDVFDGKRRFRMTFKDKGVTTLQKSALNAFEGKARICAIELIPQEGFAGKKPRGFYKIQEDARKQGTLPIVWLGRFWKGGPLVPVRMLVKSEYGTVIVHLQNAKRTEP